MSDAAQPASRNEDGFRELYVDERLSTIEFSERFDTTTNTIREWVRRHDLRDECTISVELGSFDDRDRGYGPAPEEYNPVLGGEHVVCLAWEGSRLHPRGVFASTADKQPRRGRSEVGQVPVVEHVREVVSSTHTSYTRSSLAEYLIVTGQNPGLFDVSILGGRVGQAAVEVRAVTLLGSRGGQHVRWRSYSALHNGEKKRWAVTRRGNN
jgi:hypothetical protein